MIDPRDKRFIRLPKDATVPYKSVHGWFYTKGWPKTRIEGSAYIADGATVTDSAKVYGTSCICDRAQIYGSATITVGAYIGDQARVRGYAEVGDGATVCDNANVYGWSCILGDSTVAGSAEVFGHSHVYGNAMINGTVRLSGGAKVFGYSTLTAGHLTGSAIGMAGHRWWCGISAPGVLYVGCEHHLIKEWFKPPAKSSVPWALHFVGRKERELIQETLRLCLKIEKFMQPWAN